MQKTKSTSFGNQFTSFLKTSLRQREHLLRSGKNQKSEARMRMHMDKLYPHLHTTFTDRGAAKFLMANQYQIADIIPAHLHQMKNRLQSFMIVAKQYQ